MRWVLGILVCLVLLAAWVASLLWPELRWVAEVATGSVVVLLIAIVVIRWIRARMKAAALERALTSPAAGERSEIVALRQEMRRAVQTLKRGRGGRKGGRAALYALPWYVIVGPPAAGKTTALERSGLSFIPSESGSPKIRGTAGTRNCDWWFSDRAILLDTAGRFSTNDDDREEWLAFIDTLRKVRPKRALDGLLVAVSAADLLSATDGERERLATKLRARLDEVLQRTELVLPVYLLVTKIDLIAGFVEFWSDLGQAERSQVWGASFEVNDARIADPSRAIDAEFELLAQRLHERLLDRIPAERSAERRARIMQFPIELRTLRSPLGQFVETLCRPGENANEEAPLFRGFYLTSGTQVGRPLERVLSGMVRGFDLQGSAAPGPRGEQELHSYFLTDVFRSVILPDRNLAVRSAAGWQRRSLRELFCALGALGLAVFVLVPGVVSYIRNVQVSRAVNRAAQVLAQAGPASLPGTADDPIETLRDTLDRVDQEASGFGLSVWFGPEAARQLQGPLRRAYIRRIHASLDERLRPQLDRQLAQVAAAFKLDDPPDAPDTPGTRTALREAYEKVKLYGTLVDPENHIDPTWTPQRLAASWRESLKGSTAVSDARLAQHALAYLNALRDDRSLRWMPAPALGPARQRLKDLRIDDLPYRWALRRAYGLPALFASDFANAASLKYLKCPASNVLVRAVYTAAGWLKIRAVLDSSNPWPPEAVVEGWVVRDVSIPEDQATERAQIREQYYDAYTAEWMAVLDHCAVSHPPDIATTKEELIALKDPKGFYKTLFAQIKNNEIADQKKTFFTAPFSTEGCASRLPWAAGDASDQPAAPPSPVQKSFQPLLVFAGYEGKTDAAADAPLDKYRKILESLRALLETAAAMKPEELKAQLDATTRGVEQLLDGIEEPTKSRLAKLLEPPITAAVQTGTTSASGQTSSDWKAIVWNALHDRLMDRYPFNKVHGNPKVAAFDDLLTVFRPESGILWAFVKDRLSPWVEPGAGKYIAKPGAPDPISGELLACLNIAQEITDALFSPGDPKGAVRFALLADWSATDVTDAKIIVGAKAVPLAKGDWSPTIPWAGDDTKIQFTQGGQVTERLGRGSFSLFDLLDQLGFKPSAGALRSYIIDAPPLTMKLRSEGRVDTFRADFFSRLNCPPQIR